MVRLDKIYTRGGDAGTTSLGSGERRRKDDLRVEAYGRVDEANSFIGLARAALADHDDRAIIDPLLAAIQNDLFDLGADLCVPQTKEKAGKASLRVSNAQVDRLERDIDRLNGTLTPLKSFVLPGGGWASSGLHTARAVVRRAERIMVALAADPAEPVAAPALKYINRLSDFLFVAARYVNRRGEGDVLWSPGRYL
ncbi:MAG: cob(I)yrinic acid a,c-diamide adenosyltransferase [Beijerinckiaceae bacterium]